MIRKKGVINWQKGYSFKITMCASAVNKNDDKFFEKIISMFKKQFDLIDVNHNLKCGWTEANRECNRRKMRLRRKKK